jgi:acyl-CoA synthetase (AMP-forming)/AMP-acid ligase II
MELEILRNDQISLRITFDEDVLPSAQAELLLEQFDHTLIDTISRPSSLSNDISFFPSKLLSITPAKEPVIPSSQRLLHEFVEHYARRDPHRSALEFVTSLNGDPLTKFSWTFAELDAEANKVCHIIVDHGVQPGSLIAICFDKCPEASFSILGILKSGCGYVAIDPESPSARKNYIIEDSSAQMLLTTEKLKEDLNISSNIRILAVDQVLRSQYTNATYSVQPVPSIHPGQICYCLYTSGQLRCAAV